LEEKLLQSPFDEAIRFAYVCVLVESNKIDQAIAQLTLLLQQNPSSVEYQEKLAELNAQQLELVHDNAPEEPQETEPARKLTVVGGLTSPFADHKIVRHQSESQVRFVDIAGMIDVKKVIKRRIIDPFINPGLFQKFKRRSGGGVLLYGPPGCGKTMIAKAIATECKASFESIGVSDILNMYIGESENNLANIFARARNNKPAVLFFDELDALAFSRSKASSDHTRTIVNEFLTQLDGVGGENDQVLILGATNMPWDVDDAMKRPGRFDRHFFVPPPDTDAIAQMLASKLISVPCDDISFSEIAKKCRKFSGADIDGLIEVAKDLVIDDIMETNQERRLTREDLLMALDDVTASTLEWLQTARNLVKYANVSGSYKDLAKYLRAEGIN